MAPCHKKMALMSARRYPIERRIAISFTFARTDMVRTLKIPNPARRMMRDTVIAADMRKVVKS